MYQPLEKSVTALCIYGFCMIINVNRNNFLNQSSRTSRLQKFLPGFYFETP
jgi:hypothetical protein